MDATKKMKAFFQELVPVENSHPFDEYISVSPLRKQDLKLVTLLDKESGFNVSWHVEDLDDDVSNDYSWGLYLDGFLIGYCTIGYADDVPGAIENHPSYVDDCYLLSDVYVCPEYRHHGYGLRMITEVIKGRWEMEEKAPVFLVCFDEKVQSFYRKAGFSRIEDPEDVSCMVLESKKNKGCNEPCAFSRHRFVLPNKLGKENFL